MRSSRTAKIWPRRLPSGNISYRVDSGIVHGKRLTKDFKTEIEAINYKAKCDAEFHSRNLGSLQDLAQVQRHEILYALERLKPFNATITEAVTFFLRYAKPPKGDITIEEAIELFLAAKRRANRRERYIKALADSYLSPLERAFPKRIVAELTTEEMRAFIYAKPRRPKTVVNYLKSLEVFFNYLIKEGYCTLNPLARIEKPMLGDGTTTFLPVAAVEKMLQFALDNSLHAECASIALIVFCGVRVEEVEGLTWDDVKLETRRVHLEGAVTKKRRRRINTISSNAFEWLSLCKSQGNVAPPNYDNRMRYVRKKTGVSYSQNAMRHSFASYHIAMHEDAAKTAFMLGHPDANLLYGTYRDLVEKSEAEIYWQVVPASIREHNAEKIASIKAAFRKSRLSSRK